MRVNEFGQPIGYELPHWTAATLPDDRSLPGNFATLVRLDIERHAEDLYQAFSDLSSWTYLPYGPFGSLAEFRTWLQETASGRNPLFYAIIPKGQQKAVGCIAYLAIDASVGSIEIAHVHFSSQMKRSPISTEAIYLLVRQAFQWGYRRCEWKCDSLNAASKKTAERFGFQFEGRFRNARVYKQRSRDTDWYSIIDSEWPALQKRLDSWLSAKNFDSSGQQIRRLQEL